MMPTLPQLRSRPHFRLSYIALALAFLAAQTPVAAAQTIVFPHENVSDLRGLLNVFHTFRKACLEQPVNRDLPAKLVPEGYRIVSLNDHLFGTETDSKIDKTATLSKTGSEQGDWDGGDPFVEFSMPSEANSDGRCSVRWKRAWDYEDGVDSIAHGMFGVFDAQVSYYLEAVLRTKPEDSLIEGRTIYGGVSEWLTWCWDGKLCSFKVLYRFDPEQGIEMSIAREAVQR